MSIYRLIALDIDGTLLNSRKEVTPACADAVREASKAGKTLVYCTGRAVSELEEFMDLLPQIRWGVYASGAGLVDMQRRSVFSLRPVPRPQADTILALAKTKDVMPQLVIGDRDVIQASHLERLDHFHMGIYRPLYERAMTLVPDIYEFAAGCREDFLKINLYHAEAEERVRTRAQLEGLPLERVYSEKTSLECSALGVNKGAGLLRLCGELGVPKEACAAVGDADNDIPMIRAAGLGIAMGNAAEHVKAAADRVVADNDHDGCAEAIRLAARERESGPRVYIHLFPGLEKRKTDIQ
ncbi:MAG: Cof-type HAD-IIB family hydrolase [Clostridia bacterium]|nr:Cof-type HAD-IIB family hydrolase [Clostridia bacterium]